MFFASNIYLNIYVGIFSGVSYWRNFLYPVQTITSENHLFEALIKNGNFIVRYQTRFIFQKPLEPLWETKTTSGYKIIMHSNGNLELYDFENNPIWTTNTTQSTGKPHRLVMENTYI